MWKDKFDPVGLNMMNTPGALMPSSSSSTNTMDVDNGMQTATTTNSNTTNGRGRQVTLFHENPALIDTLWASYRSGLQVDTTIVWREYHQYRVHKVVAAVFSPVLRSFMSNAWQPNPTSVVQIDVKTGALRLDYVAEQGQDIAYLIEFMYTGKVTVPTDRVQSLLRMAEVLHVKTLVDTILRNHASTSLHNMVDAPACITFAHNDHKRHFGDTAWTLVNEGDVVDSTIVCRELCVRTHEPILAAVSPILRNVILMKSSTTSRSAGQSASLKDWTLCGGVYQTDRGIQLDYVAEQTDDVLCLLEFVYRSRTIVADVRIANLLQLATKLEVRELVEAIESWQLKMTQTPLVTAPPVQTCKKKNKVAKEAKESNFHKGGSVVNGIGSESKAERIGNGDRPRPQHRCHLCPFTSPHKQRLIQHLASIHRLDDRGNSLPDVASHCTLCDFTCTAAHQLTQHYIKCHCKDKPYRCSLCEYATVVESELERHVRNRHPDRQRHECPTCGFLARTKTGLKLHVRMHQRPKPHQCSTCDERFTSLDKLKTHCKRQHDVMLDVAISDTDSSLHSDVAKPCGVDQQQATSMVASTASQIVRSDGCNVVAATDQAAACVAAVNDQLPIVALEMIGYPCPECGVDCQTAEMLRLHVDMYHPMDNGHPIRGDIVRVVNNEEITELRVL